MRLLNPITPSVLVLIAVHLLTSVPSPASAGTKSGAKPPARTVSAPASAGATPVRTDWLPGAEVVARIGDRAVTASQFRERYYASDAEIRPGGDSLGRVQFLTSLVRKDVLGQVAQKAGYVLGFEDRAELRDYRNQLLSNMLFQQTVVSGRSAISEDSVLAVSRYYSRQVRLRLLYFPERAQAEITRLQLVSGRLSWAAACARYGVDADSVVHGVTPWLSFQATPIDVALKIWPLRFGETSSIILANSGYQLAQVIDERRRGAPDLRALRGMVRLSLRGIAAGVRRDEIRAEARKGMGVAIDTANVQFASAYFRQASSVTMEGLATRIVLDAQVPEFQPADTARTLLTWDAGRLSLGDILREYSGIQPLIRPSLNTPERLVDFAEAIMLAPRLVKIAEARGIDKDSLAIAILERRRESILVSHMVEDSVLSKVSVSKPERLAYYDAHPQDFTTYASVNFTMIVRPTRAAADSVLRLVKAGASVDSIVAADTTNGIKSSVRNQLRVNEGSSLRRVLFEELHPGQAAVVGPDRDKLFGVVYLNSYDPGHKVPYEQVEGAIDESVRNIKGSDALDAFVDRHARAFGIETHPEWVMRIELTPPPAQGDE